MPQGLLRYPASDSYVENTNYFREYHCYGSEFVWGLILKKRNANNKTYIFKTG